MSPFMRKKIKGLINTSARFVPIMIYLSLFLARFRLVRLHTYTAIVFSILKSEKNLPSGQLYYIILYNILVAKKSLSAKIHLQSKC